MEVNLAKYLTELYLMKIFFFVCAIWCFVSLIKPDMMIRLNSSCAKWLNSFWKYTNYNEKMDLTSKGKSRFRIMNILLFIFFTIAVVVLQVFY